LSVVVIGLEHTKAPFELLERVTVPDPEVGKVLAELAATDNVREVALVSTCLRTEIYAVVDRFHDAVDQATDLLAQRASWDRDDVERHESVFFDRGVATHLFKIAAGLESAVPGETEVLGQVRRSIERAGDEGTAGPILQGLFRSAVQAGRRVRTDTGIARGTTSFSSAAVAVASDRLGGELSGAKVVVLGAGGLGAGVVAALSDPRQRERPGEVILINRTETTALEVVEGLDGDVPVRSAGLGDLRAALAGARLLVTAVETEDALVTTADLGEDGSADLLVIDLGMPRNVAPDVGELRHVDLVDISHLRDLVDRAMQERRGEVVAAGDIVSEEVSRYLEEQRGRGAAPVVVALRERLESIRTTELERRSSDFADLTPAQRDAVDSLTRSMLAKLVHEPTVMLKESAGTPRGERLVESVRALFGL